MALRAQDLMEWFEDQAASLSPAITFFLNELPRAEPNRACAVRRSGGLGLEIEDDFDRPSFRLLIRGVNMRDSEQLMLAIDDLFLSAPPNFHILDMWVAGKGRLADPSYVGPDPNELFPDRFIWSAAYWLRIARN